jgi:DNA-binding NarL/FixJ family response regulator
LGAFSIVLADDHVMFREGIRKIIERIEETVIIGEVNDGLELLELLKKSSPNLVVLDISMPNLRGLEAIREIKKYYPQVKVLVLTMHRKKEFIRQALADGADGFLLKEDPSDKVDFGV